MNKNWYNLSIETIFKQINSKITGLTQNEANKRIIKYGKNQLPRKKTDTFYKIFLKQMIEPMVILLIVAMIFSFIIKENIDGFAIMIIILIDLILGTFQEWKAGKTAEALANLIKEKTNVIRDGKEIQIDANKLVVGDIVVLDSGDKISADLRIIECNNLQIDESILTGESTSVYKNNEQLSKNVMLTERKNMLFAGTNVLTGRAKAIVVETGINTEVGKIAQKVAITKDTKSPLAIRMNKFSKQISILVIVAAIIISVILLIKETSPNEIFLSVIALSVSAMPEGLALALTMALTIASNRMSKKNVVVKKLNSVEALGSCTVIASDKTGTLTVNEQTAKKIILPDESTYYIEGTGYNDIGKIISEYNLENAYYISKMGVLNNEAKLEKINNKFEKFGDSIDIAFLVLGKKLKVDISNTKILDMIPYESENKYSAVFFEENNNHYCTVKGSLEIVLSYCNNIKIGNKYFPLNKEKIEKQNELLAKEGYRVIALAEKNIPKKDKPYDKNDIKDLHFIGLVAFIDPVRKEVKNSIKECGSAGIKVLMITGDHPLTAYSIAKELNIASSYDEVTTGIEVEEHYNKTQEDFDKFVKTKKVFTRVTPLNKLEIVESLKRQGEFVAVTGDGVNDAPAIKAANIGVAMGSGTDVAKDTSNLIILDDNFKSIVAGVKEGRNAYSNIRKVSYMLLSCGVAEVLFFILSIICNLPMPLVAIQLLWLNIVTDGLQDFALSFEKAEDRIMNEKPINPKESIFNKVLLKEVITAGLTIGLIVFAVWLYLIKINNMDVKLARGYIMILMVFMQNMHVLNCRSEKKSIFKTSLKTNPFIIFTIVSAIILQIIMAEVPTLSKFLQISPVPILHMIILLALSTIIILVMEIFKKINNKDKKL
ncbi:MAG: HAD-IC family P-type ATPase [bacterium]|nr:HAD-IC family P-type ATPase [bacterium]